MCRGVRNIIRPDCNPYFLHGKITSWNVHSNISTAHGYQYLKADLTFADGFKTTKYEPVAGARYFTSIRDSLILSLSENRYVPKDFRFGEFMDYYLYHYLLDEKQITYNSYMSYRNVWENYLSGFLAKRKISEATITEISEILTGITHTSVRRQAFGYLSGAYSYAVSNNLASFNPMPAVLQILKANGKSLYQETDRNANPVTYTPEQIKKLLCFSAENCREIYLPMLICAVSGMRISECLALKVQDVDFTSHCISVERQMGRPVDLTSEQNPVTKCELSPKTSNGIRSIPVPQFLCEEILLACAKHQTADGYIISDENGAPYNREYITNRYRRMVKSMDGFPYISWHIAFRHAYATLLYENNISLKAIKESMGHANETMEQVYIHKKDPDIPDAGKIMEKEWEVLYKTRQKDTGSYDSKAVEAIYPEYVYQIYESCKSQM